LDTLLRVERLKLRPTRKQRLRRFLLREWSFWRAASGRVWLQGLVLVVLLAVGAVLFKRYEPEKQHSLPEAVYYTWSLILGEPPESFPRHRPALQVLFFVVPLVGMLVIIQGLLELAVLVGDRRHNERAWCTIMAKRMRNHIILVGVGKLGYRTFTLLRRLGEDVVVIERDSANQFLEDVRRDGSPLLIGDARREAILRDANVSKAKSIVIASDDDLANLEVALDARKLNPQIRVVLRMFDQNMADKIRDGFNINASMSQSAISAPGFALQAIGGDIMHGTVMDDTLVVTIRWDVRDGGALCGLAVSDAMRRHRCSVVERTSEGVAELFPPPETVLKAGDQLLLQGPYDRLMDMHRLK
jgi:Trk K+ transport system NAD-binding subunit